MRHAIFATAALATLSSLLLAGCANESPEQASAGGGPNPAGSGLAPADGAATGPAAAVPVESGTAVIDAKNTKIGFVGTKPDGSHVGGFSQFSGRIDVDSESRTLKEVSVRIQTDSLWSDNKKLTAHLKSADFFDVREHPTAAFRSTAIETKDVEAGEYQLTGDLTLLGNTKSISFPAKAAIDADRLQLSSEFKIDRTDFGMTYGEGRVDPDVTITVEVGGKPGKP